MSTVGFIGIRQSGRPGAKENTGNFLHGYAARHIVANSVDIGTYPQTPEEIEKIRGSITHIGVVAATSVPLNRSAPPSAQQQVAMADLIERLSLPVVVFGLGVQASYGATLQDASIPKETQRLLEVLSHHTETIAVRGAFTADVLDHFGIKNVEVVGCQSTFLSCSPDFRFPEIPAVISDTPWDRIIVSVTKISQELNYVVPAIHGGATHIGQSAHFEYNLKEIEAGATIDELPVSVRDLASKGHLNIFARRELLFEDYHSWVRKKFHQFYEMPAWFDFISGQFDLAFGTRFHGNMTAMHAGVPALWVVHDSRTKELCELLGLPNVSLDLVREGVPIRELVAEHLDSARFNSVYPENYRRFHAYLDRQGITHNLASPT